MLLWLRNSDRSTYKWRQKMSPDGQGIIKQILGSELDYNSDNQNPNIKFEQNKSNPNT